MNVHVGMDKDSGLIYLVLVTAGNVHDLTPAAQLLHDENVVYGDYSYYGIAMWPEMVGRTTEFRVATWPGKLGALPQTPEGRLQVLFETATAHIRSKVKYPFWVIKHQFGFQKSRQRRLATNRC